MPNHYLGMKIDGEIGRFFGQLNDEQYRIISQYGLPPRVLVWHEGTASVETLRGFPLLINTVTKEYESPYRIFRQWWAEQGITDIPHPSEVE